VPSPDLRTFLDANAASLLELSGPVSIRHELTALQHQLDGAGRFPVVVARRPRLMDGSESDIPVVTNLTASRRLTAAALGLDDHRKAARWFAVRTSSPVAPLRLEPAAAPVRARVARGHDADLTRLPALIQHELEPGPYLTAAHATTRDPDTGVDNTAIQRCWIRGRREMTWFPYPSSHNARNLQKHWAAGRPCPVAFWIGHHPAVVIGTQARLDYPQSHWSAAGGVLGEPLRLVPTVTHGEDILVPADAEIVIEGYARPGQYVADGPFGEYTGYLGPQVPAPLVEVSCITMREGALYHDYGSGLTDMLVPDNMTMEGRLYSLARAVAPSLVNVHVPASGRRFHAWLQLDRPQPGEARDALAAVLAYRRLKTAVAVDEDVDIFDTEQVLWALATRVQWSRDSLRLDGLSTSMLDPSLPAGARTGSKLGVDATLPPPGRPGEPRPVPPRATVPTAALERARSFLRDVDARGWPHD
jgi:2,5-furandicarboxylate decarboxylase 1